MRNDAIVILSLILVTIVLILVTFFNGNDDFLAGNIDLSEDELEDELNGSIEFLCDNSKDYYDYIEKLSSEFTKEYENSKVVVRKTNDYKSTIKIRMNSGDLPDIWEIDTATYFNKAIEKYAINLSNNLPEITNSFAENTIIKSESGEVYAIPVGFIINMMVYNKKVFKSLDLKIPQSYSQLLEICEIIKNEEIVPFGTGAKDEGALEYFFDLLPKMISNNPNSLNNILNDTSPLNTGSSIYYSYDILRYFKTKGFLGENPGNVSMKESVNDLKKGKIAMMYLSSIKINNIIDEDFSEKNFGVFPFPTSEEFEKYNVVYEPYLNIAISSDTKKLEMAKNWLSFIYNTNYEEVIESLGLESSKISKNNNKFYFKEFNEYKINEVEYIENSEELNDFLNIVGLDEEQIVKEIFDGNTLTNIFSLYNEKWKEINKSE